MAYYRSGLDDTGWFDSRKADARLLFNAEHPEPSDPLHRFGVDPGLGYVDPEGQLLAFTACFNVHAFGRPTGASRSISIASWFNRTSARRRGLRTSHKERPLCPTLYPRFQEYARACSSTRYFLKPET